MEKDFYLGPYSNTYKTSWDIYSPLLSALKLGKEEKILDAGCGEGEFGAHFAGSNLYGVDFHKPSVMIAKKRGYKKVIESSVYKTPFKDGEFDKAICIQVLQYLKKPYEAFEELKRVTKGDIIITGANFNWFKLKVIFSRGFKTDFRRVVENENCINLKFFRNLAKVNNMNLKVFYLSNKFSALRNIFGNYLASEIIGIFSRK